MCHIPSWNTSSVTGNTNRSSVRLRPVPHYHVLSWMVVPPYWYTNMLRSPLFLGPHLFLCRQSKGFIWLMCPDHSPSLRDVKAGAQGRAEAQRQGLRQKPWRKLLPHLLSRACSDCFLSFSFFFFLFSYIIRTTWCLGPVPPAVGKSFPQWWLITKMTPQICLKTI